MLVLDYGMSSPIVVDRVSLMDASIGNSRICMINTKELWEQPQLNKSNEKTARHGGPSLPS